MRTEDGEARGPSAWWLAAVLGTAMTLRLALFGGLLGWDDLEYREAAQRLLRGDFGPGSMFGLRYGLVVPLAAAQAWFGQSEYAVALVPLAYSLAELILTYKLGVLYGGPALGLAASALLAVLPLAVIAATDVHADLPAAAFTAMAFYGAKRGELDERSGRRWFVFGGLALGFAFLTKEVTLALVVVLGLRIIWLRRGWAGHGWLAGACLAVVAADAAWLGWLTGVPWYRYSEPVAQPHVGLMRLAAPSYGWLVVYPRMLLNPLHGYFGYFAGIFALVLAGSAWGLWRGERRVQELCIWWGALFAVFNCAPLDLSFTRPLFFHFPRTLHPLLIPFVLTAGLWWLEGLRGRVAVRGVLVAAVLGLAAAGNWTTHFDYRLWASVARQAAPVVERYPAGTLVAADGTTMRLLRSLLPHRRERIVGYGDVDLTTPRTPTLVLRGPVLLTSTPPAGQDIPAVVAAPPPQWEKVAEFPRPQRPSLRGVLREWIGSASGQPEPLRPAPAELWSVRPMPRPAIGAAK